MGLTKTIFLIQGEMHCVEDGCCNKQKCLDILPPDCTFLMDTFAADGYYGCFNDH